ncbi:MAG: pirin family protein [Pigmentiphaga sp.]
MSPSPILQRQPLGFPWPTLDPFLFCAHHDDHYPRANGRLGPAASLAGRQMGQDFSRRDGWSMYHGEEVPGFPAHPHRGFETVTLVRQGLIDHSDSLGAAARFGDGDVQWLTAGRGITHAEMFPLLHEEHDNPVELFQIWLNLPAANKMAEPYFAMLWAPQMPRIELPDDAGRGVRLGLVAGTVAGQASPPPPPPDSWAARADADVAIWTIRLEPGARWTLPPASGRDTRRMLYFFAGAALSVAGEAIQDHTALELDASQAVGLQNGANGVTELLLLQGRPIGEPVVQYGPFVMNREAEIRQALDDYRRGGFGAWNWPRPDPVHGGATPRFARYPDGRTEHPG